MFNEQAFKMMKKTAVFVNIARGQIVDQPALINALETNSIFAAGLDVTTPDPLPLGHKLFSLPNCGNTYLYVYLTNQNDSFFFFTSTATTFRK